MKCPQCNRHAQVTDTRQQQDGTVMRRHKCSQGHVIKTSESIQSCKTFKPSLPPLKELRSVT